MKKYFNFILNNEHKFVFAYVPKVACTNWKCLLRYMAGGDDYLNPRLAHDRSLSGLKFISETINIDSILTDKAIKKFSFVRNPYSRLLSAFLNKIEPFSKNNFPRERDQHFYDLTQEIDNFRSAYYPKEPYVNFFCFLAWVNESEHFHTKNEHWLPQSELLHLDNVQFDFIGKFENIKEDAGTLLDLMGCNKEFPSQEKVSFAPTNAVDKLKHYYSDRECKLVEQIYKSDFDLFGYSFGLLA